MVVTKKGERPARGVRPTPSVAITLHLPVETVELLRDVALAHAVDNVAKGAKGAKGRGRVTSRNLSESISRVIADMLEKHAAELEHQAKTVRGASRG